MVSSGQERTMETNIVVGGILTGMMVVFFLAFLGVLFGGKPDEPDEEENEQEEESPNLPPWYTRKGEAGAQPKNINL